MPANLQPHASVQLMDLVFPGDTNHHGTLFGGAALAHMDKVAFLAAGRHGRVPFVTAATRQIDFAAPARMGEMVEVTGRIMRVGNSSIDVEVELVAEAPVLGERRICTRGTFVMVAVKGPETRLPLPPLASVSVPVRESGRLYLADLVLPSQTSHYGTFYGGDALKAMGKAAFIAASRVARQVMMMGGAEDIAFLAPIRAGTMIECVTSIEERGDTSVRVSVELWSEDLITGERCFSSRACFLMMVAPPV